MRLFILEIVTMFSVTVNSLLVDKATVYLEEACRGKAYTITANDKCTQLPEDWYEFSKATLLTEWQLMRDAFRRRKINGAKIPEGVVCDFYIDEKCQQPLWIGMEDPGTCSFSELEIGNQAVSVHCYDDTERGEI
ncbi:uncharacterized protein MAM_05126 [Metarhizium album ARSEF 1941]|uniref:Uncharacterized protein n=1 Tax=Metarhizium album (strain ARSEF 1941) TaxID=1081103 RepID=A0A0B2WU73_METAS|nr:uncharacterized protein MAM_05126 [Metarhizium album ARSEF 1941]KHN97017.1 hypothetical protein MAM_05126 [Metarhizium album ARSEF 1941]